MDNVWSRARKALQQIRKLNDRDAMMVLVSVLTAEHITGHNCKMACTQKSGTLSDDHEGMTLNTTNPGRMLTDMDRLFGFGHDD